MKSLLKMLLATCLILTTGSALTPPANAATAGVSISGPSQISALKVSNWKIRISPARKATVTVYLDGKKVFSDKSTSAGILWIEWNPSVLGIHSLVATTAASGKLKSARSADFYLSISKLATKIESVNSSWPKSLNWNSARSLTAIVTPDVDTYNKGRKIQLEWLNDSTKEWEIDDSTKTDSKGKGKLSFATGSELTDGGDTCDSANMDNYDGREYTYRLRALGTKLTKEAVSRTHVVTFYCADVPGDSSITADAESTQVDLSVESINLSSEVTTESTDYTVSAEVCDTEIYDCSDEANWGSFDRQDYAENQSDVFYFTPVDLTPSTYQFRFVLVTQDTEERITSDVVEVTAFDSNLD